MNFEGKVLGIRYLNFKNDKGELIQGHQIYVAGLTRERGWRDGVEVVKCWVADSDPEASKVAPLKVGSSVHFAFSRRGKARIVW